MSSSVNESGDLAARMLEVRPDIPILLCTGYSGTVTEPQALEMGVRHLMNKPFSMPDLARTVRQVLD